MAGSDADVAQLEEQMPSVAGAGSVEAKFLSDRTWPASLPGCQSRAPFVTSKLAPKSSVWL
jgi:hypothetical protein